MRKFITLISLLFITSLATAQHFITSFGAVGDGNTLCTRSIQAAIDEAASQGGGTVVVPAGRFVTGTLYLRDHVELHLDSGAVLLGSLNPFDYVRDSVVRWTAMLFAINCSHVSITGHGTIDGRGFEVANNMVHYIHLGLVEDPLKYDRPNETRRPENIHMRNCDHVVIRDITLKNPASWNQQYDQCRNLLVEGVSVDSKSYWNNDGIDIVDCRDVVIRHCDFDAADDVFCFKSHSKDGVCENVVVEHCRGRSSANGIKFGTVTRGTMRHFRFRDITIYDTYRSAITVASVDGAMIEDVEFDSIRSLHTGNPLFLRFSNRNEGPHTPCLKDIVIRNFYAEVPYDKPDRGYSYEGPVEDQPRNISPSSIVGMPHLRIENVKLENVEIVYPGGADSAYAYRGYDPDALCSIDERGRQYPEFSMFKELPAWGFYIRHADNIEMKNVRLRVADKDYRPAIVCDDASHVSLDGVEVWQRKPNGKPQVVSNNSSVKAAGLTMVTTADECHSEQIVHDTPIHRWDVTGAGEKQYKASLFGCKSNGTTMNTSSIQYAIDHISRNGGGRLVFEVGRYLTGSIHLRDNVTIELREGAILVGSPNIRDYDLKEGHPCLIWNNDHDQLFGLGYVEHAPCEKRGER